MTNIWTLTNLDRELDSITSSVRTQLIKLNKMSNIQNSSSLNKLEGENEGLFLLNLHSYHSYDMIWLELGLGLISFY